MEERGLPSPHVKKSVPFVLHKLYKSPSISWHEDKHKKTINKTGYGEDVNGPIIEKH